MNYELTTSGVNFCNEIERLACFMTRSFCLRRTFPSCNSVLNVWMYVTLSLLRCQKSPYQGARQSEQYKCF